MGCREMSDEKRKLFGRCSEADGASSGVKAEQRKEEKERGKCRFSDKSDAT